MSNLAYPASRWSPIYGTNVTAGTYPAYVTLYDSGDPAAAGAGGFVPGLSGYLHARCTSPVSTSYSAPESVLVEIRHYIGSVLIGVEEFGLATPVSAAADADGSGRRTVWSGYELLARGNRVVVAATGSAAEMIVDWTLQWGACERPRVTEIGGAFAYDASGGNIAIATIWARVGVLRPMKSMILTFTIDNGYTGTAFNPYLFFYQARRTIDATSRSAAIGPVGALAAYTLTPYALAGAGADATIDQNLGYDFVAIGNGAQLNQAGPDVGRVTWRATTVHV